MSEALIILFVLFFWTAILTVVALVLRLVRGRPTVEEAEVEELRAMYARGEIPYEQYDRRRRQLVGAATPRTSPVKNTGPEASGGQPTQ